ncbi:MAG: dockerin type I domain-containing protein, partial [Clostridiales bacterium]
AKMIANTSTYQIINVSNDNLRLVTYDAAGGELDSVTILPKTSTTHPIPPSPPGIAGDINNDGMVDMADVGKIISAILICDYQNMLMDINHDGVINICDAHALALLCP